MLLARVDELGKPAWLAIALLAFWAAWPLGLAVLAFLAVSGRLRTWRADAASLPGRWSNLRAEAPRGPGRWGSWASFGARRSGNAAFDGYREETLRRLEDEQREFQDYLERLRRARDKAEFDGFMAERRRDKGSDTSDQQGPDRTASTDVPA